MILELLVATAMVLLTVVIHAFGIRSLSHLLLSEARRDQPGEGAVFSLAALTETFVLVIGLFVLHGVEIWLYAALYWQLGALADFETSVYFSTITYAAIGFDDEGIATSWRLVAAIEGVNGLILLGWSTAFFVRVVARLGGR